MYKYSNSARGKSKVHHSYIIQTVGYKSKLKAHCII